MTLQVSGKGKRKGRPKSSTKKAAPSKKKKVEKKAESEDDDDEEEEEEDEEDDYGEDSEESEGEVAGVIITFNLNFPIIASSLERVICCPKIGPEGWLQPATVEN